MSEIPTPDPSVVVPPVVTPPVAAPPVVAAKPPKPSKAPQVKVPAGYQLVRDGEFMKRVTSLVKSKLGMTLEEAAAVVNAGGTPAPTQVVTPAVVADQVVAKHRQEVARLTAQIETEKRERAKADKKTTKDRERHANALMERDIVYAAQLSGFKDPDYAKVVAARAVRAELAAGREVDKATFFSTLFASTLKADPGYTHFYAAPTQVVAPVVTPPVAVTPTITPPESQSQGGDPPSPKPPASPSPTKSVDDMTPEEFNRHASSRYGHTRM